MKYDTITANIYQLREFNAPEKRSRYIFADRYAVIVKATLQALKVRRIRIVYL
jgi:hypothetical protein